MSKLFFMLVGLPATGKSTFITNTVSKLGDERYVVLSSDNYLEKVAAKENKTYNEVFSGHVKAAHAALAADLEDAIAAGVPKIFWDQTNLSAKSRAEKLRNIPADYSKIAVVFREPDEVEYAKRLASRPGKNIPAHVIDRMRKTLEMPSTKEGFDLVLFCPLIKRGLNFE